MKIEVKKISTSHLIIIFLLLFALLSYIAINKFQKRREINLIDQLISVNLITSVHPSLPWDFKPIKSNIKIKPGDVTTAEYLVEN